MSVDASDLDGLARSFRLIPVEMVPKLKGVVTKSALNTKKIMRKDAAGSKHFKQLARTINYDIKVNSFGGDGVIEGEVGPSGGGSASLAGIAYFGTSRPGGGTLRNPEDAMLEEAPNFYEFAFKATEGLL
ncbi:hypothetical protein ASF74_14945 [Arthrobacter sp. Leaf145]|nr:hypothetical protein ASF74_14945 [Arthrobacter sp. Leaf145]